jgi:methyltransferase (TIGR00027 family)
MTDVSEVRSTRTAGDSWDITESVGTTALGVAACRAIETGRAAPLIRDEFAHLLVAAAGPHWARMADGQMDWHALDDAAEAERSRREFDSAVDYQAVRTHFFDDFFDAAADAGITQVVILASGLDSRPYRLGWPAGTVIYEIDQPMVLQYKATTLGEHGVAPRAVHVPVPIDLRDDWAHALTSAGFDSGRPTAWLAEGLLPYLPADAQDRLFDIVTDLSAPGSAIAVEAFVLDGGMTEQQRDARRQRQARVRERMGTSDVDVETLVYAEPDRAPVGDSLDRRGWRVETVRSADEMARLGRPVPADLVAESVSSELISGRLAG